MRILSKNEQDLCRRILIGNGENNYLGNIINYKLEGVCISITRSTKNVTLEFSIIGYGIVTDEEANAATNKINEISIVILTAVSLISLLEKDGYIMLLQRANQVSDTSKFGGCISNYATITHHFADENISKLLIEYVDKEIYITDEFREFCRHGFIARDEQRFRKQIFFTKCALIGAIIASTANLKSFFSDGTKIKQEQIDSIRVDLKTINSSIDSLNNQAKQTIIKLIEDLKTKIKTK